MSETARQILDLVPLDSHSTQTLDQCFTTLSTNNQQPTAQECLERLNHFYFNVSPSQMLYNLKTTLINFLPADIHQICFQAENKVEGLHVRFLNAGGLSCLLTILTESKSTEQCDLSTRKSIYFVALYLLKRLLIILAFYQLKSNNSSSIGESLEQILTIMPTIPLSIANLAVDKQSIPTSVEQQIANVLFTHRTNYPISKSSLLQYHHIRELIRLIWRLATNLSETNDFQEIHQIFKEGNVRTDNTSQIFINLSSSSSIPMKMMKKVN